MKTVVITLENYFRASIAREKYTQSLNCELKFLFILVIHHVFAAKLDSWSLYALEYNHLPSGSTQTHKVLINSAATCVWSLCLELKRIWVGPEDWIDSNLIGLLSLTLADYSAYVCEITGLTHCYFYFYIIVLSSRLQGKSINVIW